jgi:ABC-type nickel/cobalt efflux system permease component RcnA
MAPTTASMSKVQKWASVVAIVLLALQGIWLAYRNLRLQKQIDEAHAVSERAIRVAEQWKVKAEGCVPRGEKPE